MWSREALAWTDGSSCNINFRAALLDAGATDASCSRRGFSALTPPNDIRSTPTCKTHSNFVHNYTVVAKEASMCVPEGLVL